ncbi:MAG: glycyl-radical enzyme activating protein [Syntrophales bacterium]|nr:glycyl-radical enzyme activating protein [Syntrophales bacterium]
MQINAMLTSGYNGKGRIFNTQRYSIHDGPGIRTTVFLKGCPLRCGWCANPESQKPEPEIMTRDILCIGCGRCVEVCPQQAIILRDKVSSPETLSRPEEDSCQVPEFQIPEEEKSCASRASRVKVQEVTLEKKQIRTLDWARCDNCLKCAEVCPAKATVVSGEFKTVSEVMATVLKDRNFYRRSNGGMTISGGEPMMQWRFTLDLLKAARSEGIHTALDTTGFGKWEILDQLLEYTNLVLFDVKHLDSLKHREATGVGNESILENLRRAVQKATVWIRRAVIPGFNDSDAEAEALAQFVANMTPRPAKISLLSYHKFAEMKYASLGKIYEYRNVGPMPEERIKELKDIVEAYCDVKVDIGK